MSASQRGGVIVPIITVSSTNRTWYLIGTIVFVLIGIAVAIAGFASGTVALGIVGIVLALGAVVLLIDALTQ